MNERTPRSRTLIIAEVGMNHDGDLDRACQLADAAAACGADVVKFQAHLAEAETLPDAPNPPYFTAEGRHAYFTRTAFTVEQWRRLKAHVESRGVRFLSSVFSREAVEMLERVGVDAYKIPSGEVTNLPLLERVAKTGKPVLLSSGMSDWAELDAAVAVIRRHHDRVTLLQCTSEYPCAYERVGLNVLAEMQARYGLPVGLSDHTMTPYAAFAAVALGAAVIEKHFTLSRQLYGSDAKHSVEPSELTELVRGVRAIEAMRAGPVDKNDLSRVQEMRAVFQKSLVALADLPQGAVISREVIGIKKPGTGLPATMLPEILGKRAARAIKARTVLTKQDIE